MDDVTVSGWTTDQLREKYIQLKAELTRQEALLTKQAG